MYKGFVLSESLKNPLILNDFEKIYVKVESHPEAKLKIWHDFKLKIEDNNIDNAVKVFAEQIRNNWYVHFWNDNIVYIILSNKIFKIPKEPKQWQSKEYQELKEYAVSHGVEERYLDFWIED